ncbi:uncharacterized protein RJT20DRAFT_125997 [Scheffersomyces xylosifermentans]|uniref:uncharacterized protein n=1 Tax=Scheffersomyces xylosifermentans TaxID=1304137 RepID=UPI00315D4A88
MDFSRSQQPSGQTPQNRPLSREEITRMIERWKTLRTQYGEAAINVPEFVSLNKFIKLINQQQQMMQQQQQGQNRPPQTAPPLGPQSQQTGRAPQSAPQQGPPQQQSGGPQSHISQQPQSNTPQMSNGSQFAATSQNSMPNSHMGSSNTSTPSVQNANLMGQSQIPTPNYGRPGSNLSQSGNINQGPYNGLNNGLNNGGNGHNGMNSSSNINATSGNNSIGLNNNPNTSPGESAFTPQQFQLVKSQFQALKYLLNKPSANNPPIPQNLISFVTNDRSAFPSGNYLPAAYGPITGGNSHAGSGPLNEAPLVNNNNNNNNNQAVIGGMSQQVPMNLMNNNNNNNLNNINNMNLLANKKGKRGPKPKVVAPPPKKPVKKLPQHPMAPQRDDGRISSDDISGGAIKEQFLGQGPTRPLSEVSIKASIPKPLRPIVREPEPPVRVDRLVPDKAKNNQVIIPVNKPNIQVDTFEVPDFVGENVKDIDYNAIYTPQSRLQYPGILPDAISMDDIFNNKESFMILRMEQEMDSLRKQLEALPEDSPERLSVEVQLAQLELLPFQKELRGKVLSQVWFSKSLLPNSHPNFLAKFNTLSLENVSATHDLYRHQLETLLQVQNQKHQKTLNEILSCREKRDVITARRRDRINRFATKIASFHNQTAKEEQKRIEKMAKQRLQALKSNDEEAYLKLLDHTKDTRITHLLKQTNQFLDSLAQAVQSQQRESQQERNSAAVETQVAPMDEEKREKVDYYHVAHRIKEEITKQPEILIGGTLKEYQLKGLQWMVSLYNNHLNGILADEMGLGKTIQTISLLTYLVEVKKVPGPFIVIVPLSTLTNWNLEFDKWAPAIKKITYKGTPNQRKVLQNDIRTGNFQILLTTFEYVIKDKSLLARIKWVHMIIDEGHRMKNSNSKLSETLTHNYHSDYRLILTGTPLQNNLPELWALLNFVLPKIFNSVKSFDEWFNTPFANTGGQDKIELSEEETLLVIRRLHKVLRPFLLRRLKKDVEKDLPNKVEKVVKCKMSSLQSKLYQQMLVHNILYTSHPDEPTVPVIIKNANNQIMQLRKICNHPFVYEEVERLINPTSETNDQIWRVAGKFELLDKVLIKFKQTGHRVLIFFQMTQIMDIMEDFLRLRDMKYMRLDGGTKADDRTALLKLFNAPDSDYFCFLLSTRAGGLGLNLQTADTVIIFDTDWNPHQDLQAQDRAHRIGQKNEVRILRLITEDSVEEMILERAHAKLEIDGKVIQAGKFDNKSTAEEQEAMLRALIEKEEERKQKGNDDEEDDLDDDELNQIIARNENELEVFRKLDEERAQKTKMAKYPTRLFSEQELPEIYKKDADELLKSEEVDLDDYGRGNRERKTATYDDHLTEEQWLRKIEGVVSDESDTEVESKPKRSRGRPRGRPRSRGPEGESKEDTPELAQTDSESTTSTKRALADETVAELVKRQKSSTPKPPANRSRAKPRSRASRAKPSLLHRATPTVDPLSPDERAKLQNIIETIYGLILNFRNSHDRKLSELFLVKPSRKLYPDYYVLIKHPIALDIVKKRTFSKIYTHAREMLEDLHLMFSNARIYNEEGSIVYQDASALEKMAIEKFKELSSDLSEEEVNKILDFKEFDETFSLKPLVISAAIKQPIEAKLEKLDNDEPIASPIIGLSTNAGTEESTPMVADEEM